MSELNATKNCPSCSEIKPAAEFGYRSYGPWLNSYCKPCRNTYIRNRRAADPLARTKERAYENRPEVRARDREKRIARAYGLEPAALSALKQKQKNQCAICAKPFGKFHVDHCHKTGRVRGLLCPPCNVAIAQLGDNAQGVMRAVQYLQGTTS